MEKDPNKIEKWRLIKDILSDADKSKELHNIVADNEETIHEKLLRLPQDYWEVINQESESDYTISEKDVYEANFSDIEKKFDKNSTEYKIFQVLKNKWLKIFINPKTDISFTSWYNMIRWRWPVTEQSKSTMGLWSDVSDEKVYTTKLVHEMWHILIWHNTKHNGELVAKFFNWILKLRKEWISVTKLWDLDRYQNFAKINEDSVEFVRMYIQNPEAFKTYLWTITTSKDAQNLLYNCAKDCVDVFINNS